MGTYKLTPEQWDEIRQNVISGKATTDSEARRVGVAPSNIRKKSIREGWNKRARDKAALEVTKSWIEKAEEHRQRMFAMATEALNQAKLPPPKNWRDAETADKIARRAAGLEDSDGQKTLVSIGLLRGGPEPATLEIEGSVLQESSIPQIPSE